MDISTLANIVNAFALTAGVIFGRRANPILPASGRRRDAMLELVRSFQSPAFTAALRRVLSLPDGADAKKIREVLGPDGEDAVYLVFTDMGKPRHPALSPRSDHGFGGRFLQRPDSPFLAEAEDLRGRIASRDEARQPARNGFTGWRKE